MFRVKPIVFVQLSFQGHKNIISSSCLIHVGFVTRYDNIYLLFNIFLPFTYSRVRASHRRAHIIFYVHINYCVIQNHILIISSHVVSTRIKSYLIHTCAMSILSTSCHVVFIFNKLLTNRVQIRYLADRVIMRSTWETKDRLRFWGLFKPNKAQRADSLVLGPMIRITWLFNLIRNRNKNLGIFSISSFISLSSKILPEVPSSNQSSSSHFLSPHSSSGRCTSLSLYVDVSINWRMILNLPQFYLPNHFSSIWIIVCMFCFLLFISCWRGWFLEVSSISIGGWAQSVSFFCCSSIASIVISEEDDLILLTLRKTDIFSAWMDMNLHLCCLFWLLSTLNHYKYWVL